MSHLSQYGRQSIGEAEVEAVVAALRSGWLTTGPSVEAFEQALAARIGAPHVLACANGTAALWLAYRAAGVEPGDRVVVPAITFAATATAALHLGARVEVVDVEPDTGALSLAALETHIRRHGAPRLVVPVHYAGRPADMAALGALAERHGFALVEDACHALGAHDGAHPVGAARHAACAVFSFHPVKSITTGEGGAVSTTDPEIARRLALLRSHGIEREASRFERRDLAFDPEGGAANPWYGELQLLGWNFRLSDLQAALGQAQLARLDEFLVRRQVLAERYDGRLAGQPLVTAPPSLATGRSALHLYPVAVDFARAGRSRATVMRALQAAGVGSQVHYLPLHWQPLVRRQLPTPDAALPGAERFYARTLSLPLHALLEVDEVDLVVGALENALRG